MGKDFVTVDEVAEELGITPKSADNQLRKWGIEPAAREPGRGGRNLYPAKEVQARIAARPGRGRWGRRHRPE